MVRFLMPALLGLWLATSPAWAESPFCAHATSPGLLSGEKQGEPLCDWFDARAVLIVNTASQCGYTPQFKALEEVYQTYREQGLVVLGFPSDNFGGQEYADPEKTAAVCYRNYGVSFPMFRKIDVKGPNAHPLFRRLTEASHAPRWNFHKYLVAGSQVRDFRSSVRPDHPQLLEAIEQTLQIN